MRRPSLHLGSRLAERLQKLPAPLTRDITVERDLRVPMRDGVVLFADRYAPRDGGDGLPVALMRSPYGRRGFIAAMARPLAERGYQVVMQSCRGTFGSGGAFEPMRNEREDGLSLETPFGWGIMTDAQEKPGAMLRQLTQVPKNLRAMRAVPLRDAAHRFKRGHRIRVQVSSGAFPRYASRSRGSGRSSTTGWVTESTPKTKTGDRLIWLDAQTVRILKEHRTAQLKARLMMGESWQDSDLILCQDDGTPYRPDAVTRRFERLAALAGLPVIKLHEGRHSAASLARDAAVGPEIRRRTLGHADAAMTAHYTHIEAEAHKAAAEAVAKLVESASS